PALFARPRSLASQTLPIRSGSLMDRRTSAASRLRPLGTGLPPFVPVEEHDVERMGTMDPVQEAEFDVTRPARPRDEGDRGPLSRAARAEHAAREGHRLGDVP